MITGIITRDEIIGMMIGVINAGIIRIIMIDDDRGTFLRNPSLFDTLFPS